MADSSPARTPGIHPQALTREGGRDLRYTLAIPADFAPDRPAPLVIALHYGGPVTPFFGRGVLADLVEPALRDLGALIAAPDCPTSAWANPQSEGAVVALLDHLTAAYRIDPARVILTGYSLGGMGTWYIAARHQARFSAAIPVAGQPQPDTADFTWTTPLYVLHSRHDGFIPLAPTEEVVGRLKEAGARVELVVVEDITHFEVPDFVPHLRAAVPWIKKTAWA
jgi:predicted peptidase